MLKSDIFSVSLVFLLSTACSNIAERDECVRRGDGPGCVVVGGRYESYNVGMTKREVFTRACQRWNERSKNLFVDYDGRELFLYGVSICDAEQEVMRSNAWTFVEDENDNRYISLNFDDGVLSEIVFLPRGGDS